LRERECTSISGREGKQQEVKNLVKRPPQLTEREEKPVVEFKCSLPSRKKWKRFADPTHAFAVTKAFFL
jgi:hypothetical protein